MAVKHSVMQMSISTLFEKQRTVACGTPTSAHTISSDCHPITSAHAMDSVSQTTVTHSSMSETPLSSISMTSILNQPPANYVSVTAILPSLFECSSDSSSATPGTVKRDHLLTHPSVYNEWVFKLAIKEKIQFVFLSPE